MPGPAASATSGITIEAVNAAAVSPVTAFSFKEACTSSLALDLDFVDKPTSINGLIGSGLRKDWELGGCSNLFWDAEASGIAIETEAIFGALVLFPVLSSREFGGGVSVGLENQGLDTLE